jgi:hypothetical protein
MRAIFTPPVSVESVSMVAVASAIGSVSPNNIISATDISSLARYYKFYIILLLINLLLLESL